MCSPGRTGVGGAKGGAAVVGLATWSTDTLAAQQSARSAAPNAGAQISWPRGSGDEFSAADTGLPRTRDPRTPYEQRTEFMIGNLGWDLEDGELLARGKQVLTTFAGDPSLHTELHAPWSPGSIVCGVVWASTELQFARFKVAGAKICFTSGHKVWLDAAKTREELRPSRFCERMQEWLQAADVEACGSHVWDCHKGRKRVSRDDKVVGTVVRHAWKWSAYGSELVQSEQYRAEASEYAEDTCVVKAQTYVVEASSVGKGCCEAHGVNALPCFLECVLYCHLAPVKSGLYLPCSNGVWVGGARM